jgi:serine/threonine protein phosphatase 1
VNRGLGAGLLNFFAHNKMRPPKVRGRPRLVADDEPAAIYAIGDVHGCLSHLKKMEEAIIVDGADIVGEKWIVMLGDVVDRGPHSAQVIDHLLERPPQGFLRITLAGNHEVAMSAFLDSPSRRSSWLTFGGFESLLSYGMPSELIERGRDRDLTNLVQSYVPREHLDFLSSLAVVLETPRYVFVHAGLRANLPLALQSESDLLWLDDDFAEDYSSLGKTVVHGHTPVPVARVSARRISVDTEAYSSGRLSAVRLTKAREPALLVVSESFGMS